MRPILLLLVATTTLMLALPAHALSDCTLTTTTPTLQVGDGKAGSKTIYVHVTDCPPTMSGGSIQPFSCVNSGVYQETNLMPGLQRDADTCDGRYPADFAVA